MTLIRRHTVFDDHRTFFLERIKYPNQTGMSSGNRTSTAPDRKAVIRSDSTSYFTAATQECGAAARVRNSKNNNKPRGEHGRTCGATSFRPLGTHGNITPHDTVTNTKTTTGRKNRPNTICTCTRPHTNTIRSPPP